MKRREPLPDLSGILDDSRPTRGVPPPIHPALDPGLPAIGVASATPGLGREKRIHTRFDKAFPVVIGSELYGDSFAIARNVSSGGILVEMSYAPPLGTVVTVHFQHARGHGEDTRIDEIVVRSEVKHHHYLNFTGAGEAASTRAIGLRFLEFVDFDERVDPALLH